MSAMQRPIAFRARRSCVSVPGHAVRMHEKALSLEADEVVFDLEDAVAPGAKAEARAAVAATLTQSDWAQRTVAVRVNLPGSGDLAADLDLIRVLRERLQLTVVVPKVETPDELLAIAESLGDSTGLQALIETPAGIEAAAVIARSTGRLCALILGYADLAAGLGLTFEGDLLRCEILIQELEPLDDGGLVHARILVSAQAAKKDDAPRAVLDWRPSALMP